MEQEELVVDYLRTQSEAGITKHLGGSGATKELIELCRISEGKYVLDVGCGIGITASLLAKKGCRVAAVDISEKMVHWAKETAKEEEVGGMVEFFVADAKSLPFEDNTFDAVICESVLAFVSDKKKALDEFVRVTKPGGYIGLNESIWLKTPTKEVVEYFFRFNASTFLYSDEWVEMLKESGLHDIVVRTYRLTAMKEFIDRVTLIGFRRVIRGWVRVISKLISDAEFRKALKGSLPTSGDAADFMKYTGYAIYAARK
jgi:ubiquinone/menaquinone biosynthesis C-methylase UbiE